MKTKTHFAFRIDAWDADGNNVVEHRAAAGARPRRSELPDALSA
jgi:hypothetical protein